MVWGVPVSAGMPSCVCPIMCFKNIGRYIFLYLEVQSCILASFKLLVNGCILGFQTFYHFQEAARSHRSNWTLCRPFSLRLRPAACDTGRPSRKPSARLPFSPSKLAPSPVSRPLISPSPDLSSACRLAKTAASVLPPPDLALPGSRRLRAATARQGAVGWHRHEPAAGPLEHVHCRPRGRRRARAVCRPRGHCTTLPSPADSSTTGLHPRRHRTSVRGVPIWWTCSCCGYTFRSPLAVVVRMCDPSQVPRRRQARSGASAQCLVSMFCILNLICSVPYEIWNVPY